jgi:hypothetical protein
MRRTRGRALVASAACLAALSLAACGRDDYENEPRPPTPAEISIQVTDDDLTVSPKEFGAGIANITIVNLGDIATKIAIHGPSPGESALVGPGNSGVLKLEMEPGNYEATAADLDLADVAPFEFVVGPERESANNELLLP